MWLCVVMYVALLAVIAGLEVGVVYAARPAQQRGDNTTATVLGIVASVVIGGSLLFVPAPHNPSEKKFA